MNIFHNNIYPNLTKIVENIGQILFTIRLNGFHRTDIHETHKYRSTIVQTADIRA